MREIIAKAGEPGFLFEIIPLGREEFLKQYDSITVNENLLGLKQVYLKKCLILRPDSNTSNGDEFQNRLFDILQSPLKERLRNYRYEAADESVVDELKLAGSNFVVYISPSGKNGLMIILCFIVRRLFLIMGSIIR